MRPALLILALSLPHAVIAKPADFDADLRRDPARAGFTLQGADDGRFAWLAGRHMTVTLDSNEPAARLIAPLGMTLDGSTSFHAEADIVLSNVDASPDDFFQIAFGLANLTTTGLNRTGTSLAGPPFFVDDSDVFDSVEIAYFPNVTFFGGPFLQPTVFGAESGSAFANFAANFGPSSDLGDNGPGEITELPQGRPLRVAFIYDACTQLLVTRVFDMGAREPVELLTGMQPLDLSVLNVAGTFTVDAFALSAYQDLADFDPSTRSLAAELDVLRVSVRHVAPLEARLLPPSLNEGSRAPVRVLIRDAAEGAAVTLVESDGVAMSVPLQARATGAGLVAIVPRELASATLTVDVGGCLVSVAGPVVVPR